MYGCGDAVVGALKVYASITAPVGIITASVLAFEIDRLGGKEMKLIRRMVWSVARFFLPLGSSW